MQLSVCNIAIAEQPCTEVIKKGDYPAALKVCSDESHRKSNQDIEVLLSLVEINHELGDDEQEAYYLAKIKTPPTFLENIEYQYQWNRRVGQKYYFLGDYQQAKKYLHKGLDIATTEAQQNWQSKSYNDVGLVAYKLKDHTSALSFFKQSLNLKRTHGNAYEVGKTLNNIALVHMELEEHEQAVDFYEQALDQYLAYVKEDQFDERVFQQIAHIYEDLTQAYTASKNVVRAKDYAAKMVATFKLKNSPKAQARALLNLTRHHLGLQQYPTAKVFLEEAKRLKADNDFAFETSYFLDAATIAFHHSKHSEAVQLAEQGLNAAIIEKDHRLISQFYARLSDFSKAENPSLALRYMEQQQQSREAFLQEKYDKDLSTIKHEVEKQQIKHDLINEQLLNAQKSAELQRLTNGVLLVSMVLLLITGVFITYVVNKKREQKELLKSIKHHKQQLFMMQNQHMVLNEPDQLNQNQGVKQSLKVNLVSTMIDALSIWEKTTGKDRIELAESSKVWTISIDNGTLRTRSLDKYLDVEKIPKNPRWRNVVKTCHFILSREELSAEDRSHMEQKLAELLDQVKQLSLGKVA